MNAILFAGRSTAMLLACVLMAVASGTARAESTRLPQEATAPRGQTSHAATSDATSTTPRRALVLAPHIAELMYAAGAGQYIVATIDRSDFPSQALAIPRVGDGISVSAEASFSARPDIILDWRPSGASSTLKPLADRLDIPIVYVAPRSLDDIPKQVERLGRLFGTEHHANARAQALQQHIDSLRSQYGQRRPLSVFIQIGDPPLFTIGSDPVLNDALKACGGNNIFAGLATEAAQVSRESVLLKQPDVVITPQTDTQRLQALRTRWAGLGLGAARDGKVYAINADQLFRPGPRLIDATQRLCTLLDAAR
ncbi:ABC transporter substrate-binding protein [Pusillimonas sp. ANT_WB101]|uniref:ABC transporter substrate-binding protein n=1 Tax=Pusillimonas sp. ANT_WB101 TaxID=2597356 RepID=UPI0011EC6BAE|nr:ABC transporter substrate-binding protein [Pusillimonas sp. ANT_WB101]KAA0890680.1 ABC transporter substrate-binding protein [Pusillimonas sp. ANT_WB101]